MLKKSIMVLKWIVSICFKLFNVIGIYFQAVEGYCNILENDQSIQNVWKMLSSWLQIVQNNHPSVPSGAEARGAAERSKSTSINIYLIHVYKGLYVFISKINDLLEGGTAGALI